MTPISEWPELMADMEGSDWFFFIAILVTIVIIAIVCISNLVRACKKKEGEGRAKRILKAILLCVVWLVIIGVFLKACG